MIYAHYITLGVTNALQIRAKSILYKMTTIKQNFQYTILENFNAKVDDSYVLRREAYWKEVLQSRKFGYNKN